MRFLVYFLLFLSGCSLFAPYTLKEIQVSPQQSFIITNRNTMEQALSLSDKEHIVISVCNKNSTHPDIPLSSSTVDVLKLKFDDVRSGKNAISYRDAQKIVNFYRKNSKVPCVVVQCDVGISRSAAIAAAIAKYSTGSDYIVSDGSYIPNSLVFETLMRAFEDENLRN